MAASYQIANNAWGNVASAVAAGDTTIALTSGQGQRFPSTANGNWFYATMIDSNGVLEIVQVTNRTVDVLTVVRGVDGTLAKAFTAGSAIEARLVAQIFNVDNPARYASRDGSLPMLGNLDFGGFRGINLGVPTVASDAARKDYVDNLVATSVAAAMPRTSIVMLWNNTIPSGWQLCNGANGTPNLYDRMPIAAGSGYGLGAAGGETAHTLSWNEMPNHNHGGSTDTQGYHGHGASSDQQGQHDHAIPNVGSAQAGSDNNGCWTACPTGYGAQRPGQQNVTANGQHAHNISIAGDGNHYHNVTVQAAGASYAHNNMPPYMAVYFIMKMF